MDETVERFLAWIVKHVPWVQFILLGVAGGVVAHVRAYEQAKLDFTAGQHFWAITRRSLSSGFAALLVYFATAGTQPASPWAFFIAGLCGLYAAEAFDLAWRMGKAWASGRMRIVLPAANGDEEKK